MYQIYQELYELLINNTEFTSVFDTRLFAIYAREDTPFPLAVYTPMPSTAITKDATEYQLNLGFYFGADQFTECAQFYDAIKPVLENSNFVIDLSSPQFDVELRVNIIIANLKKIN